MSRRSIFPNGHDASQEDLDNTGLSAGLSIRERSKDIVGTGVVTGLNISLNVDGTYNISAGIAYDANGERIAIVDPANNLNLASLVPGVTTFVSVAYKGLLQRDVAHPITGILSETREEESFNPKSTLTFNTTPGSGESEPPLNLDENGNPLVLIATIVPDTAGGFTIDESVRTFVLTTTENLSNLQQQIDANKNAINTVRGEVIGGRLDFDTPQTLWSSLTAHFFHFWERLLGHINDQTNPHKVNLDQAVAQGGGLGSITPSFLHPQSLSPSTALPRIRQVGVNRLITIDPAEIAIGGERRINTGAVILNLDAVGVNGRDVTTSIVINTTYFLYGITIAGVVAGNTFETVASLNSSSPSFAELPGYAPSRQRLLTTFKTDGSGNIVDFDITVDDSIPAGAILMWNGTIAAIPSGWLLCNGSNGTPNLVARFVKGTASNPGTVGGTSTHAHSLSSSNTGQASATGSGGTQFAGGSTVHRHPMATIITNAHIPPFYDIVFIMKAF